MSTTDKAVAVLLLVLTVGVIGTMYHDVVMPHLAAIATALSSSRS